MYQQGKLETKTQKQCKDYIRPLFKLCKAKKVPDGIRDSILEMVDFCDQGEFVKVDSVRYIPVVILLFDHLSEGLS